MTADPKSARPSLWLAAASVTAIVCAACWLRGGPAPAAPEAPAAPLSPVAVVAAPDGKTLYVAEATARRVVAVDVAAGKGGRVYPLPAEATGLAISSDGATLYATCGQGEGRLLAYRTDGARLSDRAVGHSPTSPVVAPDNATVYLCDRFRNCVLAVGPNKTDTIGVVREPIAAAITGDGKTLVVANHLPAGPAIGQATAAAVSIIDTAAGRVAANVLLPDGATGLRGVAISPDGRHAAVTHTLGRYHLPTTQLERGWMNANAISIIDVPGRSLVNTVLLDDVDRGAANPWAIAWSDGGRRLVVTHAGTHELSAIDADAMLRKLHEAKANGTAAAVSEDLTFFVGIRNRVRLAGNGPRGLAVAGEKAWAAEYFSDTLCEANLGPASGAGVRPIPLGPGGPVTEARSGERWFHDATLCFQHWQSCSTCHPDARTDGLNWDLLNDGIGNPKNTRSLLLAHTRAPVMSSGVRANADDAVNAGIRHIQMAGLNPPAARAIEAYLRSLQPLPSPHATGADSLAAIRRGQKVFESAGCPSCHAGPLGTDQQRHDIGLADEKGPSKLFTPPLVEIWRTGPYLFDGRAATMTDVFTRFNPADKHGKTSRLSNSQVQDMVEYLNSR